MADKLTYSVVDNKLTIDSIHTNVIDGDIFLDGDLTVNKNLFIKEDSVIEKSLTVGNNLNVGGEIRATVIHAETVISKNKVDLKEPVYWDVSQGGIEGKGLVWKRDKKNVDIFVYKSDPNRIFTNLNIDLYRGANFSIDGTPVLTADSLGQSIVSSSLRKVGRLKNLTVDGDTIIGEHIFYDATSNRLGIGTDHANASFSLVDNGIEFVMGSLYNNEGNFGTFSSHDFGLITDNITRIKLTRTGKVIFGNEDANNADVSIHGKLYVKELIVDQRQQRTAPLEFRALKGESNYGKGMVFTGHGANKQFIFASEPDQFFSTENINLQEGRGYFIENNPVLFADELGPTIRKSHLNELGTLSYLKVNGEANFNDVIKIYHDKIVFGYATISLDNGLKLKGPNFELASDHQSIKLSGNSIVFGDKDSPLVNTIINGKLAIGVQSISDNTQLEVAGNIKFCDKLFMTGNKSPTTGSYKKGDIVWNDDPKETGYVGWVCIRDGNPGIWRKFGQIGVE